MSDHDTAQEAPTKRGPGRPRSDTWQAGYDTGYQQGLADGQPKPPLFEACKHAVLDHPERADELIHGLEASYGETLSLADRDLIEGMATRATLADRARRDAFLEETQPRNQRPRTASRRQIVDIEPDIVLN